MQVPAIPSPQYGTYHALALGVCAHGEASIDALEDEDDQEERDQEGVDAGGPRAHCQHVIVGHLHLQRRHVHEAGPRGSHVYTYHRWGSREGSHTHRLLVRSLPRALVRPLPQPQPQPCARRARL